jgi:hypothetical protein
MPSGSARIARRGLAACLVGVAIGGSALGCGTQSIAMSPPTSGLPAANAAAAQPLSAARLNQLVAPIALYPDPLLAQILMASTYPLEVVQAARWVGVPANRALTGDALAGALAEQNWDPSVKALVAFPEVLENMSIRLQWTEDLGNAFLVQKADVMSAVQQLRHQALATGNLRTSQQCDCRVEASGDTVAIPTAEPEAVRVPVYGPEVYGPWSDPDYPPDFFPGPAGFAYLPGFSIGFGAPVDLAFFGPLWGWSRVDWRHREIAVDRHRFVLAAGHAAFAGSVWIHDPAHRRGVRYRDAVSRAQFDAARVAGLMMAMMAARSDGAARRDLAGIAVLRGGARRFATAVSNPAAASPLRPPLAAAPRGAAGFHPMAGFHTMPTARGGAAFNAKPTAFRGGLPQSGFRGSLPLSGLHGAAPGGRPR